MDLANKYRPQRLEDITGQENVVKILSSELKYNKLRQQYLFVGNTGSGKTTTARILAKAVNGQVFEIDAASHSGVEDIRALIETITIRPMGVDHTVVILDEVHGLSNKAVQTLLLTLEKPPKHVIFILCTTEADKVPDTIKNRCECFIFQRIPSYEIADRLEYICKKEQIEYAKPALKEIAKIANGSLRQAISYLEQVSSKKVTMSWVSNVLRGNTYREEIRLFFSIVEKKEYDIINILNNIQNPKKFLDNFFKTILDLMIYTKLGDISQITIPLEVVEDVGKLSENELAVAHSIIEKLFDLEATCKNNPILRELMISRFVGEGV